MNSNRSHNFQSPKYFSVPSAAPLNVTATGTGPFKVFVSWKAVSMDTINGFPLGYHVYAYYHGNVSSMTTVAFDLDSVTYTDGLQPSQSYVFEVCPFNSIGDGPCDKANAMTLDSRKLN